MDTKTTGIFCTYDLSLVELPFSEKPEVRPGDQVIFRDGEGKEEFGVIRYVNQNAGDKETVLTSSNILRKATANDLQKMESHAEQGTLALDGCSSLIEKLNLQMTAFRAMFSFDGSKIHFMFTADERVDFRDLVKELASKLKKQIHLRQVGPRDKAKMTGGFGRCGRTLCCNSFLDKLESINMEMVRDQGLESKGSSKLSGSCGKLLCCLKYEVEAYRDLRKELPQIGSIVRLKKTTPFSRKDGRVSGIDVLNRKLRVDLEDGECAVIVFDDVEKIIKN
jgi:cell fate regulator YaaT (PSP1 superfamily)